MTDGRVAIVGGGLGGFVAYLTLLAGGVPAERITVFATEQDPAGAWRRRAESIRQRRMRSESDGHCLPHSFPGLAVRAARTEGLVPLILSLCNRYHPTVDEFLDHVSRLRAGCDWDEHIRLDPIRHVDVADDGFELDSHGVFQHALIATGHAGLAVPEELENDSRTVHAYEPHEYADEVAVVGAGMAAATEWLNALAAGASVVSVRRHDPVRRPLTVPRDVFSRRGLRRYHEASPGRRVDLLRQFLLPSYPPGREWDEPLDRAAREGRFRVSPTVDGEAQVVCATGFLSCVQHDPLIQGLVRRCGLETRDRWLVLADDCTVPSLTDERRTLGVTGVLAQWAYPAADTLVGMKYAAHSFLRRVRSCPTP